MNPKPLVVSVLTVPLIEAMLPPSPGYRARTIAARVSTASHTPRREQGRAISSHDAGGRRQSG